MYLQASKQLNEIWDRVLDDINSSGSIEKHIFDTFFGVSQLNSIEGNTFIVVVNSKFSKDALEKQYSDEILRAIHNVTQSDYQVSFITLEELEKRNELSNTQSSSTFFENSRINPALTFTNFVVGPFNMEAHQASLLIASTPGKMYNPLFIYSESGLGKTHLLHAIGNYIKGNLPNLHILYVTANDFVDEYIDFVKNKKGDANLKNFFRDIDVFLVDDVQFLAGKVETETMFFTIYNNLYNNNKQIILTSDRHPLELKGLEQRLVSRFSNGLTVNIKRPDVESAKNILKMKISASNLNLERFDDEVLTLFAEKFSNNIRELEGALNRLVFFTINTKSSQRITMNLALESLGSIVNLIDAKTKLDENKIINCVADYYNFSPSQLTGKSRIQQVTLARHVAMYLMRYQLDTSLEKIGRHFGNVHHTTVMNGVEKVENLLKTNLETKEVINTLKRRLR